VTGAGRPLSPTLTRRDPQLVYAPESDDGSLELRINFGLFTGREATPAEIDLLGQQLPARVEPVTIISERHHQIASATWPRLAGGSSKSSNAGPETCFDNDTTRSATISKIYSHTARPAAHHQRKYSSLTLSSA
jgi:hypothetical protein